MKTPMQYQMTEFDCGQSSVLNALRFLFEREEIVPEMVKHIEMYTLDSYNDKGEYGKNGTSKMAMMFLASWLNDFSKKRNFPLECEFLEMEEVVVTPDSKIAGALENGGVVVLRLVLEVGHYVLLTGVSGNKVEIFDPYYWVKKIDREGVEMLESSGLVPNRRVTFEALNTESNIYSLGNIQKLEAVIIYNTETKKS
ncbi:peptidase C39 [Spirochaetia bacterium]|nr:peptidase C39 [Spirochaetia bacterium]